MPKSKKNQTIKFSLTPFQKQVIILRTEVETETKSGIILTGMEEVKINEGTIVACGEDCNPLVRIGRYVLFDAFAGSEVDHHGITYLILEEDSILAFVDE